MLDYFCIASKGGLILWSKTFSSVPSSLVNSLISDCLIPAKSSDDGYTKDSYRCKWILANEVDLVFVAVYQRILQLPYIDDLLEAIRNAFLTLFEPQIRDPSVIHSYQDFDEKFEKILYAIEDRHASQQSKQQKTFKETKKFQNSYENVKTKDKEEKENVDSSFNEEAVKSKKSPKPFQPRKKAGKDKPKENGSKKKKVMRKWDDSQLSNEDIQNLDYSNQANDSGPTAESLMSMIDSSNMGGKTRDGLYDASELDVPSDDDDSIDNLISTNNSNSESSTSSNRLFNFFKHLSGQRTIQKQDLEPVLHQMKEHLINKNVAADIADHLCKNIGEVLVGKKVDNWKTIYQTVKGQLEISLQQILTPGSSTDLLRDILSYRASSTSSSIFSFSSSNQQQDIKPYTITFCGVNGVGKSTNLSKICFWLLQNNLKVLIAACDTFRSGAVEQLRTHVRNLKALVEEMKKQGMLKGKATDEVVIELYEKGYGKDAAGIAKEAVQYGTSKKFDVVLIDTAGRMQDNEPLMRSLAKLVTLNNPNKILFVGEALVGNDAVDQLQKFNSALKDFSGLSNPRQIDGIILTKFDTISDKVGAALSMTYITGKPILFVGTGQTYTDLKKMNVKSIVGALLKR